MKQPYSTSRIAKTKGRVYRLFSYQRELLYVGCSLNAVCRVESHSRKKWFKDVGFISIGKWRMRENALREERQAIKKEKPKYNTPIGGKRNATKSSANK